jgi:hypothetical protein
MPTAPGDRIRNFDLPFWIEKSEKVQQTEADSATRTCVTISQQRTPTRYTSELPESTQTMRSALFLPCLFFSFSI